MNALSDIKTAGLRATEAAQTSSKPVLPLELTPLVALGAILEPLFVNSDWTKFQLHGPCSEITLPSLEQARNSLWIPQPIMDGVRDFISYETHDLRVIKISAQGEPSILVSKRVEPNNDGSGIETAPINGFWWSIGGRREIPRRGSELEGKFGLIDSMLLKAKREAGIEPRSVLGIYDLGIGRTEFPKNMIYVSKAAGSDGEARTESREVTLAYPQRTINRNLVLIVESDTVVADQSVEQLSFLSENSYLQPETRARFCEYEQTFMDAVFEGLRISKLSGRTLSGTL